MHEEPLTRLLTAQDLAYMLAVSVRTVWRWTATGQLPAPVKLGTNAVRWRESDIRRFLEQLKP